MRDKLDRYYTPDALARACVDALEGEEEIRRVFEPSAGGGAFVRALHPVRHVAGCDLDPAAEGLRLLGPRAVSADFLSLSPERCGVLLSGPVLWVIGNPPYRDAEAHVRHALRVSDRHVAFLLRASFLGSQKRVRGLWRETSLRKVWHIAPRPSFTGDGRTDGAEYALFWWDRAHNKPATIDWIDGWR